MFRLPLPVLSLRRRLVSMARSLLGRAQYRFGALPSARRSFERVLELMGDDFTAYVHLGLIARTGGDRMGAAREFDNARRTDPERYARLRLPREIDAAALEPLLSWDRSFWSPVPAVPPPPGNSAEAGPAAMGPGGSGATGPGAVGRRRSDHWSLGEPGFGILADDDEARAFPGGLQSPTPGRSTPEQRTPRDDFRDASEARSFRDRRPIAREEIARVDFDALARALQARAPLRPDDRNDASAG